MTDKNAIRLLEREFPEIQARFVNRDAKRELAMALRSIRKDAGLTQSQLAERAGWSQPQISRLESPKGALPETETVIKYAVECGANARMTFESPKGGEVVANLVAKDSTTLVEGEAVG